MILDIVKDKEIYQKHLHEYKRRIQRKRRIWEDTQQFHETEAKVHAYAKIWGNIKGKHVESYGDLILLDLYMHCQILYQPSLAGKTTCYDSISYMPPFFTNEEFALSKGNRSSMYKASNAQMDRKGNTCMDK